MNFSDSEPSLPVEHLYGLARLWGGAGDLIEWLGPSDDLPEIQWSRDLVRARVATAVLSRFQNKWLRHLPKSAGDWLDLLSEQILRTTDRLDYPTAHTDWPATIAEFGRYPAQTYVERRPVGSYDTSHTRVLKAASRLALRADSLAAIQLGPPPLSPRTRAIFDGILALPAVAAATDESPVSTYDLAVCRSGGGVWLIVARLAEELTAIWSADPAAQIKSLVPILPQFSHQLFELSTIGAIVERVRQTGKGLWRSQSPIGAARKGRPCISWEADGAALAIYYQVVPESSRSKDTPYAKTAANIGGVLRPDIWLELISGDVRSQIVIECKFSLDPSYVASGIVQSMAYSLEFPPETGISRRHIAVGPSEVVTTPTFDGTMFHLCNEAQAAELVSISLAAATVE